MRERLRERDIRERKKVNEKERLREWKRERKREKERESERERERTFESKLKVFVITTFFVSKTEGEIIKVFTLPIFHTHGLL